MQPGTQAGRGDPCWVWLRVPGPRIPAPICFWFLPTAPEPPPPPPGAANWVHVAADGQSTTTIFFPPQQGNPDPAIPEPGTGSRSRQHPDGAAEGQGTHLPFLTHASPDGESGQGDMATRPGPQGLRATWQEWGLAQPGTGWHHPPSAMHPPPPRPPSSCPRASVPSTRQAAGGPQRHPLRVGGMLRRRPARAPHRSPTLEPELRGRGPLG